MSSPTKSSGSRKRSSLGVDVEVEVLVDFPLPGTPEFDQQQNLELSAYLEGQQGMLEFDQRQNIELSNYLDRQQNGNSLQANPDSSWTPSSTRSRRTLPWR